MFGHHFHHHHHRHTMPGGRGGGGHATMGDWSRGWFGGGHPGRGGRGGGGRMFDGGELKLVLLKLIGDEPRHGYDLIRSIEALTGGAYAPSAGIVYPTLTLLADMDQIAEQQSGGAKKSYAITDEGRAVLAAQAEAVDALMARLTALGEERERIDSGSIRRAITNLGAAVATRLRAADVTDDTLHDIAALLDEVAQKVERLR